jgi:hypothetical protein
MVWLQDQEAKEGRRPRGRFCQKISNWMDLDRSVITYSFGSASGSTLVLIARESCTDTYSLPTFSSNFWSLGTFSKIFVIGLPMMILCERFLRRSKM